MLGTAASLKYLSPERDSLAGELAVHPEDAGGVQSGSLDQQRLGCSALGTDVSDNIFRVDFREWKEESRSEGVMAGSKRCLVFIPAE